MKRAAFVTSTTVLVVTVVILFAGLAAAQRCIRNNACGSDECCVARRGAVPGTCSTGSLGELCGGRNQCNCTEGVCKGFRCRLPETTTTSVAPAATTVPAEI